MKYKNLRVIFGCTAGLVTLVITFLLVEKLENYARAQPFGTEFYRATRELETLLIKKDLPGLMRFNESAKSLTGLHKEEQYVLRAEICKNLNSVNFADSKHAIYARRCAKELLRESANFSVDLEFGLLKILQEIEEYRKGLVDTTEWPQDRRDRIRLMEEFHTRYQREYDPAFDFKKIENIPATTVCVDGYRCGIRAEEIKNKDTKAIYLAKVHDNIAKARRFNEQRQLHQISRTLNAFIDDYIRGLYSQFPHDKVELTDVLGRLNIDGDRRSDIIQSLPSAYSR